MPMKYTPGPWRTGDMFTTVFGPPNGDPCPEVIVSGIRKRANARLIAAAPELLEALQHMNALFDEQGNLREDHEDQASVAFEKTHAALIKALGSEGA